MITFIAALDRHHTIGVDGDLPWHLPADLQHFKKSTQNKVVIMGRRTYNSIGRPLPRRLNVVLSRSKGSTITTDDMGVVWCPSIAALSRCCPHDREWMVIGGGEIYQQMMPYADKLVLSLVETEVKGDCCFPKWEEAAWQEVAREHHAADEQNQYAFSIVTLERKPNHLAKPLPTLEDAS